MAITLYFTVLLIFEVILYTFHLSIFILLVAKRNSVFRGSFYRIFRVVIAADLLCFCAMVLSQKISLIPIFTNIFQNSGYFASLLFGFLACVTFMQFYGHLLMAFNRFTLIWFPLMHSKIWKRSWHIFILLLFPFLHVCWRLHESTLFVFGADDIVNFALTDPNIALLNYTLSTSTFLIITFLAAVLNVLSFIKFYFYKQTHTSFSLNERNLLFVSFIILAAQLLRISFNVCRLLFSSNIQLMSFYNTILPVLNDIFAFSSTVSLLLLSAIARKEYLSLYFCTKLVHRVTTTNPKMFPGSGI